MQSESKIRAAALNIITSTPEKVAPCKVTTNFAWIWRRDRYSWNLDLAIVPRRDRRERSANAVAGEPLQAALCHEASEDQELSRLENCLRPSDRLLAKSAYA